MHSYNEETFEVYQYVSDQWLAGCQGAYALDLITVIQTINLMELSQPLVLELARNVCDLGSEVLKYSAEKAKLDQQSKKEST